MSDRPTPETHYAERDIMELEEYYIAHVSAMTSEELYSKSAIAAELAFRDKERDELREKHSCEKRARQEIKAQRDELRAEVERLKAENVTFRNAQMCCESCDDTITTESLRELRADKARLDWIIETCRPNIGKPDGMFYKALSRELIDADMKGDK